MVDFKLQWIMNSPPTIENPTLAAADAAAKAQAFEDLAIAGMDIREGSVFRTHFEKWLHDPSVQNDLQLLVSSCTGTHTSIN